MFNFLLQLVPYFIPMNTGGGGDMSDREAILLWIALNIIFLFIYGFRSILWVLFKRKKEYRPSFKEYVIWDDDDYIFPTFTSMLFVGINALVLLILTVVWLIGVLDKLI